MDEFRHAILHEDGIENFGFVCTSPTLIHMYEKNGVVLSYYAKDLIEVERDDEEMFSEKASDGVDLCYRLSDDDIEQIRRWCLL